MSNEAETLFSFLPGYTQNVNYIPNPGSPSYIGPRFPSALGGADSSFVHAMLPMTTLREFAMMQLMNSITDKPDWNRKINNAEIAGKWKEEALASANFSEKMIDWCIEELRYKASLIPEGSAAPPVVVYNGDVVKSDNALSEEFKVKLQDAVRTFEQAIPGFQKDWHPGSDEKVWDLVHPSLFPLVYGRTRIVDNGQLTNLEDCIKRCGDGKILELPPQSTINGPGSRHSMYSRKFQWLPCEVDISQPTSKITSYINNLHPQKEKPLYRLIEDIIDASIPLWDLTLAPLNPQFSHELRIEFSTVEYNSESQETEDNENEDDDDFEEHDSPDVVLPEPDGEFSPLPPPPKFSLRDKYGKRGLQVIVKLANIELTPEKPEYDGGSWHIEGQLNEHIVATALYYYESTNITPSSLSFRQWFSDESASDIDYEQDKSAWLSVIYGCTRDGPCVQNVGGVETREGRLLTFPNILQHHVEPFRLADPTIPGRRKIVALFLVDPNIKIISTAHVPCQRQDWWREAGQLGYGPGKQTLPVELQDKILEDVDFPISLREAKKLREELMSERKEVEMNHTQHLSETFTISLCEH